MKPLENDVYITQSQVDLVWNNPLVKAASSGDAPFSVVQEYRKNSDGSTYLLGLKGYAGGFFGCCGIGILAHCRTADNLRNMHSLIRHEWSCLMYSAADYQTELIDCLEELGYKRVNEFHNHNSGNTVYIYCWNKDEE